MKLTEAQFLRDIAAEPGGHARKPHYWLRRDTRAIYLIVWRAWFRGLVTCPLFQIAITPAGRAALAEKDKANEQ